MELKKSNGRKNAFCGFFWELAWSQMQTIIPTAINIYLNFYFFSPVSFQLLLESDRRGLNPTLPWLNESEFQLARVPSYHHEGKFPSGRIFWRWRLWKNDGQQKRNPLKSGHVINRQRNCQRTIKMESEGDHLSRPAVCLSLRSFDKLITSYLQVEILQRAHRIKG